MTAPQPLPTREEIVEYVRANRNWGRWGEDDELGALNLITDAKRVAATRLVRTGRSLSLARPYPRHPAPNNPTPAVMYMERFDRAPDAGGSKDYQAINYHGCTATHIDALCHTWDVDGMWNGRDPDQEITIDSARWGSIDRWKDGILTRGVLLDIPRFRGGRYVTQDTPVHGWELEAVARSQGVTIEPGDAIAVYCGREASDREGPLWTADPNNRPGLDATCLKFFREADCSTVLWDMWDIRPTPYNLPFPVHAVIFAFGVAVVDAALLEPLAAVCQGEGRYDFMLTVNPINVVGGTGCLVNPVATF
ncbi:cyclase family protein [Micromonospora sp. WMMD1082]|uniref:cyclase family protein n=1 Tax=Micromonospora sp. WMMD1082 TaxID=3016104 RepID=UPI0024165A23|nr:cyclase family protein [Micromonospora sp. WMMD1082]MDG4798359.1 cyclase family protein [Micromonospora sp. WMMD1082]